MSKRFRTILILFFVALGIWFLYPTFRWYFLTSPEAKALASSSREEVREYARRSATESLEELEGLVRTEPDAIVPEEYQFLIPKARDNYEMEEREIPDEWTVSNVLSSFQDANEAFISMEEHYRGGVMELKELRGNILELGLDLSGGLSVTLEADMESLEERIGEAPDAQAMEDAILRAMEVLTSRIDRFGVTEPEIRRQGNEQIYIEVPGVADPDRVQSFLLGSGSLNFHIVDQEATQAIMELQNQNPAWSPESAENLSELIPAGSDVIGYYTKDDYGIDRLVRYIVIKTDLSEYGLSGNHIDDATVANDPITGRPLVNFMLDDDGADIFFQLTQANVGESLAIVLDDKVRAYARISEAIPSGQVRISGFEYEEAQNLALVLRTGAMPVDLQVVNQQAIGASLGEDAINQGLRAIALGFGLIIVFMLIYYKGSGIIADLALVLNLFFIIAILSAFQLTLTLTSIAGIILTVGMAVDANVIIFERIKEEYRLGKSAQASVASGFKKAFWTIMDANITTFIAAIFLSQLAKGPIQGFAVTLAVGIVSSMFTALFISRLIFDFGVDVLKVKKLSITWRKNA
ncbi:MAG: protein translocase subunit SecD [Spirochaetia bacterium]